MTGAAVLDLRIRSLVRDTREVLRDVSWTVSRGEHWVVLGPNGAGKSTLVQVLAGYLWPSAGSVAVLGQEFGGTDLRALRKAIGVVSSSLAAWLPRELDGLTTVATGFEAAVGLPWVPITDDQRAAALAALTAISAGHLAVRTYGTLSQGEQQRVMIARALVHRPALLVLDEPCAGLDPVARERFVRDLSALAARSRCSLVLVTHHLEEIPACATHALVLGAGRVVASGPLADTVTSRVLSEAYGVPCDVVTLAEGRLTLVPRL